MKRVLKRNYLSLCIASLLTVGCSSDSDPVDDADISESSPDLAVITRIDDQTGFLVAIDTQNDTVVTNANAAEVEDPFINLFSYNGTIYTTGSLRSDKIVKYSYNGTTFVKDVEISAGEASVPTAMIFVNDSKSYVTLFNTGEILVVNPSDLSIDKRIDISEYALGEGDINPEPTSGIIKDGKLYVTMSQIDDVLTFKCQAGASVLKIDVATDTVEKHIQDPRSCASGEMGGSSTGIFVDEIGDIYVNNQSSFGFYPDLPPHGLLRIRDGAEEFDPDYFFPLGNKVLEGFDGFFADYAYRPIYAGDGKVYTLLVSAALGSNPPDYAKDKNNLPYRLDIRNQTITPIDIPRTNGWSDQIIHDDRVLFGMLTDNGPGLYRYDPSSGTNIGDQTPHISTAGGVVSIRSMK